MVKVDLTKKPYFLEKEDIQWVEDTIAGMTTEEKIGQLFVNMGSERSEEYLKDVLENITSVRCVTIREPLKKCMNRTVFCRKMQRYRF